MRPLPLSLLLAPTLLVGCGPGFWCERFNLQCDLQVEPVVETPVDVDLDGWVAAEDCDDNDPAISPSEEEICDGIDNDCDGRTDEGFEGVQTWYQDADQDGWGDDTVSYDSCFPPGGYVATSGDCDDHNAMLHPGQPEVCDEVDSDCDGDLDDGTNPRTFYADADGDGYGDNLVTEEYCNTPEEGWVLNQRDCDDTDELIYPGAEESCDEVDSDCDASTNDPDSIDALTFFADTDLDGYGDPENTQSACELPEGYLEDDTDCDDTNEQVYPGAEECPDGLDNDCDGDVDEDTEGEALIWYRDADVDGYGDPLVTRAACEAPSGYTADDSDCDDTDASISPAAIEVCDEIDNDCDSLIDDDDASLDPTTTSTWREDADGDSFGGSAVTPVRACVAPAANWTTIGGDCDETDPARYPGAPETCEDGLIQDCLHTATDAAAACAMQGAMLATVGPVWLDGNGWAEGAALWAGGDLTGHGGSDLAIGATGRGNGAVYLLSGATSVAADLRSDAAVTIQSGSTGGAFGSNLDGLDLDQDGYLDLAVGSPNDDTGGTDLGVLYLFYGPITADLDLDLDDPGGWIHGTTSSDHVGEAVAFATAAGALGSPGFWIGVTGEDTGGSASGSTYLWMGVTTGKQALTTATCELYGGKAADASGTALATGDFNGDGLSDLAIGAPDQDTNGSSAGAVYLFMGPTTTKQSVTGADAILLGVDNLDVAGTSLAGGTDIDGDGLEDLLVGAPKAGATGVAYLVLGPGTATMTDLASAHAAFLGTAANDLAGSAVSFVGDINGDGVEDIGVGAPDADFNSVADVGAAYLIMGVPSGTQFLGKATGSIIAESSVGLGAAIVPLGDTDGDGFGNIAVGAPDGDGAVIMVGVYDY